MKGKKGRAVSNIRVMHYVNQFFAGIGGEDKADKPVSSFGGAIGPGKRLQKLLGDSAEIVVTAYCGDDYFGVNRDEVLKSILNITRLHDIELVIAGPAFSSGRYGFACVEVCHYIATTLDVNCVTGLHHTNPAVEIYKQYKNKKIFAIPTTEVVSGMEDALRKIAQLMSKLSSGAAIGSAAEENYIPRGIRQVEVTAKNGVERAFDMMLDRWAGRPFITEIPIEYLESISPAPRITTLVNANIALVSTTGVVPQGNPDGFKMHRNTQWKKYNIAKLNSMQDSKWDAIHGGYNTAFMRMNPNFGVPLDVCREMEREGMFSKLLPYFYATSGINALISAMQVIGKEIASDLVAQGVNAALLVST
jgi:glycine reductase